MNYRSDEYYSFESVYYIIMNIIIIICYGSNRIVETRLRHYWNTRVIIKLPRLDENNVNIPRLSIKEGIKYIISNTNFQVSLSLCVDVVKHYV